MPHVDAPVSPQAGARILAAALFAAAARHPAAGRTQQLRCLAACAALRCPTSPVPPLDDSPGPDALITQALRTLGELDPSAFAHPDVLAAARHGRRALTTAS